MISINEYKIKKDRLIKELLSAKTKGSVALGKSTSNLFRYRDQKNTNKINARHFNNVIAVDRENLTVEVEGMTTYEKLVGETLAYGLMPTIVPELKSITIGGAATGLGIESSSFKYGLVHEAVVEMEILLADGRVVICTADNEYKDLFFGFPNSYGTLGYVLKLKVRLVPVKKYVKIRHLRYNNAKEYFDNLKKFSGQKQVDFIDGTVFNENEMYITLGEFIDKADFDASEFQSREFGIEILMQRGGSGELRVPPCRKAGSEFTSDRQKPRPFRLLNQFESGEHSARSAYVLSDYTYMNIYYRSIREKKVDCLSISDYIWRWDTDWFWCSKHFLAQNPLVRRLWGKKRLGSVTYSKIRRLDHKYPLVSGAISLFNRVESVIQDVEIPIEHCEPFLKFFQKEIGITPVWVCPMSLYDKNAKYDLYLINPDKLYVNFGFWDTVKTDKPDGYYNRKIENKVRELGGKKSLYSTSFYPEDEFWKLYNKEAYNNLKAKYDPSGVFMNLYEKCVMKR